MTDMMLTDMFASVAAPQPQSKTIFAPKPAASSVPRRSSSGVVEFESAEQATEVLAIANHAPIQSAGVHK
jgi:hypothetical protein